jgi:cell division protease FtsH
MFPLPSVAPFADLLADLTRDLRQGNCCLVTADKGWTQLLFHALRDRLRAIDLKWEYIDGKPNPGDNQPSDVGVMLTAITQLRRVVRTLVEGIVVVLPHLDVMATSDGGWTNISRELVPLLYECPELVLLGFSDPTLPLLPVVEKLFPKRYVVSQPFSRVFGDPDADVTHEQA